MKNIHSKQKYASALLVMLLIPLLICAQDFRKQVNYFRDNFNKVNAETRSPPFIGKII